MQASSFEVFGFGDGSGVWASSFGVFGFGDGGGVRASSFGVFGFGDGSGVRASSFGGVGGSLGRIFDKIELQRGFVIMENEADIGRSSSSSS